MLFNSIIFWIFLFLSMPIYYLLKSKLIQKIYLIVLSLFFYAYWEWKWLGILIFSILVNFVLGQRVEHSNQPKKWLIFGVILNLSVLVAFKYFSFFITTCIQLLDFLGIKNYSIFTAFILPIGISFYTFHAIGYLIDIYRKDIKSTRSLADFSLYMCFFPFLVAGPIVRAKSFLPQLHNIVKPTREQLQQSFFLITIGLFQKVMIGDACGRIVDSIFCDFSKYATFEIIAATILFSFQIYADFAGYSNIARGLGKLMGIELMGNFKQPYFSKNIKEFWSRWHISLSTWLRDYLYFPLGGNKNGKNKTYRNLLIVMTLGGLWHGAGWNFILWGFYHGLLLILFRKFKWSFTYKFLNILTTFILVVVGWFLFRLNSLSQIQEFYYKLLNFDFGLYALRYMKMIFAFGGTVILLDKLQIYTESENYQIHFKKKELIYSLAFSMLCISFLYMFIKKPFPFIYFQF